MTIPFDSTKAIDTKIAILNTNFVFEEEKFLAA